MRVADCDTVSKPIADWKPARLLDYSPDDAGRSLPNKTIRIEMLPKSNPSYGYDIASLSSALPMHYSRGR